MKRIILALLACCLAIALTAPDAVAFVNEVIVESKQVAEGATGVTVGVYVENDLDMWGIVAPFELREVTPGSYIATTFNFAIQGRVVGSGLMNYPTIRTGVPPLVSNTCSGPVSHTFGGPTPDPPVDFVSPDCAMFVGLVTYGAPMPPGADTTGGGQPSFLFTFDVTTTAGTFEIDTCCVAPANNFAFVDAFYQLVIPSFTKGTITIGEPPNDPPVALCTSIGINTSPGLCERTSIDPAQIDDGSYDPDVGDVITLDVFPAGPYPVGVNDIWLVVTDNQGAADTCQATVTVTDTEDPVITCRGDTTLNNDPDACGAVVTWDPATATDNCGIETVSCDPASGSFFPIGVTEVTCTAIDVNGRSSTCTFNVTVEDTQPLLAVCPDDMTVGNDPDQCGANVDFLVEASDNCPGATVTASPPAGSWFDIGQTLVEVIATNLAGEADTCTFTVTVEDTQPPVVTCGDISMPSDPGECSWTEDWSVGGDDNCSFELSYSPLGPGDTFPIGTTQVTVIGTDPSGNADTCVFNVTIYDAEDPVATCGGDITVSNDADGCGAVVDYGFNISADDNCPGVTIAGTPASGSFFPVGTTQVEVVATDAANRADTCYFDVIVEDDQAPWIFGCPGGDYEVSNDPDECGATLSFDGVITADDNCDQDVALTGLPIDEFFPVGTTAVTVTATDDAGNETFCQFNVVVTDDEPPTAMCPNDTAVIVAPQETEAVVTWTATADDNCPGATISCVPPSGSTFQLGPTLVTCTAVDDVGNQSVCTFTVTVTSELVPPVAQCTDVTVPALGFLKDGSFIPLCAADASIDDGSYDPDGGAVTLVQDPAGPYDLGQTTVNLYVTDDEGDADTCQATVTVVDEQAPIVTCLLTDPTLPVGDDCLAPTPDYANDPGAFTADDACDVNLDITQDPTAGTLLGPGAHTISIIATDDAGNADTCSFTLTLSDETPPTLDCPQDPIEIAVDESCVALVPDMSLVISTDDNCTPLELLAITQNPAAGTPLAPGGPYTVDVTVTDEAGHSSLCAIDVMVVDDSPPVLTCPNDTIISNDPGQCGAMWEGYATAEDNCDVDYVLCNPVTPPVEKNGGGWFLPIGTTMFECTAVDLAGNQASCTYTVTVVDAEPPDLTCPSDMDVSTCDPAGAVILFPAPPVADNCGIAGVYYDPPSGLFPPGVTTVMCWAEDDVGNSDTCFFDVNVIYDPPRFVATPDTLWFTADCAQDPDSQCVDVFYDPGNCPGDKIVEPSYLWYAFGTEPWITVIPDNGQVPDGGFCVHIAAAQLPPGDYEGLVRVIESDAKPLNGLAPDSVVILLTVNDVGFDQIAISEDTLYFDIDFNNFVCQTEYVLDSVPVDCATKDAICDTFPQGAIGGEIDSIVCVDTTQVCWEIRAREVLVCQDTNTLCQYITLTNEGCGETCWELFDDPAGWLSVTPTGGTTPEEVEVCVNPCNLLAGEYIDTLIFCVCSDKEPNVPGCAAVLVKMNVTNPPILMVDPTHLVFDVTIGEPNHLMQTVDILNMGGGFVEWCESHQMSWLQVSPTCGTAPSELSVWVDFDSVTVPDTLRDTIRIDATCAWPPAWVIVDVFVNPPPCDAICGVVTSADEPLAGALVQAWTNWPDGIVVSDATTDADGSYCLTGLAEYDGPFDIRIVKEGYCTKIIEDVVCGSDGSAELDPLPYTNNPAWPFFADYWSDNAQVFGVPLVPGDVILAMDPNGVFCGATTVETSGAYLIHVLGDDPNTSADEGASPGDQITFLLNCGCPAIVPDPWMNQGNFRFDVNFECSRDTIECDLCYPWNLLSYNVIPSNQDLDAVLNSIDGKYDRAYSATCDDGPLSWELNRPINDLTSLSHMQGFGLRVTEPDLTLTIEGFEFPVQMPLNLCAGWNLIPYWPDEPDTITHALMSINGLYEQIIGFECDGAHTWVAGRPINDLFCLEPCNGYWIKMTQAATLSFPVDDYSCGAVDGGGLPKVANRIDRLNVTPYTADFWSTGDPTITGILDGDVITVYATDGTLCGEAVAGAAGMFLAHVYGDDPSTPEVEGAVDGERVSFQVNGEPARVIEGSAVWSDRGSARVTLSIEGAAAVLPNEYALFQNYPNPFNPSTVIRFHLKQPANVSLVVYNVLGQVIQTIHNGPLTAGEHALIWDGTTDDGRSAQSGVYFYRIATPEWTDVKKMTLLK